jgi:hypothetical protein
MSLSHLKLLASKKAPEPAISKAGSGSIILIRHQVRIRIHDILNKVQ